VLRGTDPPKHEVRPRRTNKFFSEEYRNGGDVARDVRSRRALIALIVLVLFCTLAVSLLNLRLGIPLLILSKIGIAVICFVVVSAVAYERFRVARLADIPVETPGTEERVAFGKRLEENGASEEMEGALFVLEHSKASYDAVTSANSTFEAKASSLLTTIAGAAGLLSLFGRFKDGSPQSGASPFLWLAIVAAAVTVVCCLYILRTKVRPFPSSAAYVLSSTVWNSDSRFQIALELAESYNTDIITIRRDRRFEGPAYYAAQIFVALAAIALLAHFAMPATLPALDHTLACRVATTPKSNNSTLFCTEHGVP
jgi:hypothetical protein